MAEESDERAVDDQSGEPTVRASEGDEDASEVTGVATAGEDAATDQDPTTDQDRPTDEPAATAEGGTETDGEESDTTDADAEESETADADGEESETADADGEESETADDETPRAQTDGEGYVGDRPAPPEQEYPDPDEDVGGISTPPGDEEMPLADHIEEMVLRLAVVLLFGAAGTAVGLLWASDAIEFVWLNVFPGPTGEVPPPHIYHPLELWMTRIKLAALLGIMVALPMFVYQCYLFMRPGLYPNERKYYLAAVPTSVILAGLGMLFSYLLVLPVLFQYFTFYAEGSAEIHYALGETFDLIITLTGFLAIVFQIPLFIMLAIMMGVTTRRWLAEKRLYFWAAFAGLSFMFTMDPTMMAPILVAIVMILLFEGTLLLLKWTGRE